MPSPNQNVFTLCVVAGLFVLLSIASCLAVDGSSAIWGQTGQNAQHSFRVPEVSPRHPLSAQPYPRFKTERNLNVYKYPPIVDANGITYYVGGEGSWIISLDPDSNTAVWSKEIVSELPYTEGSLASGLGYHPYSNGVLLVYTQNTHDAKANQSSNLVAVSIEGKGEVIAVSELLTDLSSYSFTFDPLVHDNGNIITLVSASSTSSSTHYYLYAFTLQSHGANDTTATLSVAWNMEVDSLKQRPVAAAPGASGFVFLPIFQSSGNQTVSVLAVDTTGKKAWESKPIVQVGEKEEIDVNVAAVTEDGAVVILNVVSKESVSTVLLSATDGSFVKEISDVQVKALGSSSQYAYGTFVQGKSLHIVSIDLKATLDNETFIWKSSDSFSYSSQVEISVDGDYLLYVSIGEKHTDLYGFNASDGTQAPGWKYNIPKGDTVNPAIINVVNNQSIIFVTQGGMNPKASYEILGCCSGHGNCSSSGCLCEENYYNDGCSKYCLAKDTCSGNGECNKKTGRCSCKSTEFWELITYSGEDCSEIVNLTIFASAVVLVMFTVLFFFSAFVIYRSRIPEVLILPNDGSMDPLNTINN